MPTPSPTQTVELFASRYALQAQLGRGGMGRVYRAQDTLVGDVVALKVLELLESQSRSGALEFFRSEVRLARRISHPNVTHMYDMGEFSGQHYLTMEYVPGQDLKALVRARQELFPPEQAVRMMVAVCEGLAAAHAAGVIHRDLKPANVLVEEGGRVVLTDFGLAHALEGEGLGQGGGMLGTPVYMAPEQVSGGHVDARTDLYAVGLILYEMLTGQRAFTGDSPQAIASARLHNPPTDPREHEPVPDALAELVLRCLSREPAGRPASALELAQALRTWLDGQGEQPVLVLGTPGARPTDSLGELPTLLLPEEVSRSKALRVAVLPLRFLGPAAQAYQGEALTEALIDVLARTQGVSVLGSGATASLENERDPREAGRRLGVAWLVDGRVQQAGPRVRLSARLVEAASGAQLWGQHFEDGSAEDFTRQEVLSLRAAEALRSELQVATWRHAATPETLALYQQAFVLGHVPGSLPEQPLGWLEQCAEQSPGFIPGLVLHALHSLRMWFMRSADRRDWGEVARSSVARAERLAPELAETHLARSMLASSEGDWAQAVRSARAAVAAAPAFIAALTHLGGLQCEAGRVDEGMKNLQMCTLLAPHYGQAYFNLARSSVLRGELEVHRHCMERLSTFTSLRLPALVLRLRVAAWDGDLETVRRCLHALQEENEPAMAHVQRYAAVLLGELSLQEALAYLEVQLGQFRNPRFVSLMCQLATEMLCLSNRPQEALGFFRRAASTTLIDLEWTELCPPLASLRSLPGFAEGRRQVRARVAPFWNS
jgi:eukaryotic-like serine/threonine-protein kinase